VNDGDLSNVRFEQCWMDGVEFHSCDLSGTDASTSSLAPGEPQAQEGGHSWYLNKVAFIDGGAKIVSRDGEGMTILWNAVTGQQLEVLGEGQGDQYTELFPEEPEAALFPDGQRRVFVEEETTIIVRAVGEEEGGLKLEGHTDEVLCVVVSPDASTIISGGRDETFRVWDVETGFELQCISVHTNDCYLAAFNPSGTRVVTCAGFDLGLRVWEFTQDRRLNLLLTLPVPDGVPRLQGCRSTQVSVTVPAAEDAWGFELQRQVRWKGDKFGPCTLTVGAVSEGSAAAGGGIRTGLRILEVEGKRVISATGFKRAMEAAGDKATIVCTEEPTLELATSDEGKKD